jgi:hypothetical protein
MFPSLAEAGRATRRNSILESNAVPTTTSQREAEEPSVAFSQGTRFGATPPTDILPFLVIFSLLVVGFLALIVPPGLLLGINLMDGGPLDKA